jgi:hypothetical protein
MVRDMIRNEGFLGRMCLVRSMERKVMAIIQSGGAAGTALLVDASFGAARTTMRPMDVLGWNSVGVASGLVTGLAANATIFSLRNLSGNPVLVRRVGVGFVTTTAFTAAQMVSFGLLVARSFTASDSSGTAVSFTGNNGKHRSLLGTPTSLDCRIATTAALTAGTRTVDANALGVQAGWSGAAGTSVVPALNNLLSHDTGDYPLVLAQNEGLLITNLTAMGAGGVGVATVAIEFAEASAF